jgi:hypothetical protein
MVDTLVAVVTMSNVASINRGFLAFFVAVAWPDMTILIDESITIVVFFVTAVFERLGCHFSFASHLSRYIITIVDTRSTNSHSRCAVGTAVACLSDSGKIDVQTTVACFVTSIQCAQIRTIARARSGRDCTFSANAHFIAIAETEVCARVSIRSVIVERTIDAITRAIFIHITLVASGTTNVAHIV